MKKRLVVLSAAALSLLAALSARPAWGADPGSRYADAFVLIEQGQAAEAKSDLSTAYSKYQSSLDLLHGIRTDSPDWNAQMVEYRLKDCQSRFDAVKAKLPEPPPAPLITPAVQVPTPPVAPVVVPPTPPTIPVAKTDDDQLAKYKAQIDELNAQNHQLNSQLTDAKHAAKSAPQAEMLAKENKDLKAQLAAAEKKAATVKATPPAPVPVPVDSGEAKTLRIELANANAEIERLKKAPVTPATKASAEASQNFAAGSPTVITTPVVAAPPADNAELKKLRADVGKAQADADNAKKSAAQVPALQKQNQDLSAQLAAAQKKAAAPTPVPAETAEVKKPRTDLADLQKQNKDLNAKLAVADKKTTIAPVAAPLPATDSAEVKGLRIQLADVHKELDQANKAANQVPDLEKQNKDLSAKLAAANKQVAAAAAKPVPVDNSVEVKTLHDELDASRAETDKARKTATQLPVLEKQNKDLSAQLAAEKKAEAEAPTTAPDARVMKHLRDENSYLRNLLDTYSEQNSELKGQLRRHDQNQSKNSQ